MTWALLAQNALLVAIMMTALWLVSVKLRNASIVDPFWSIAFLVIATNTVVRTGFTPGKALMLSAVALWSLRLHLHLLTRAWGEDEDKRYQAFRRHFGPERYWWVSFFQVFVLQGCLALFISAPLMFAGAVAGPDPIRLVDLVGAAIFATGFIFEAVADAQLKRFRGDPSNRGKVLATGLWKYSRHPNYFGDALLWWGLYVMALDVPYGWLTFPGPLMMTFLLRRVSGVTLLDAQLRREKPDYAAHMARTSPFVPWPPRA